MVNQQFNPPVNTTGENNVRYYSFLQALKFTLKIILLILGLSAVIAILINFYISWSTREQIYIQLENTPYRPYAIVLGTAKYSINNRINPFYHHRLLSAYQLFTQKKVDHLLLSGDNRTIRYNEPKSMYQDLQKMGIPSSAMTLDFAGFRTLDSVIRAKKIFQAEPFTLISQKFHCERALFIANYHHINAICFATPTPIGYQQVQIREFFARIRAVWDVLTNKEPYYLGKPEPLPTPQVLNKDE
ncbi:hypothetical protein CEP49_02095 [Mergibacter septicus]|uniref:SanA/YdcF family protein n=1 Tax=Mergibacter septicus TaxID=221402 RepID=UPI0011792BC0|nr:ElyC/SanA/YdcF family protein [Mergibacter septicus]AWX13426.1 hypothetical protein CEP49_02095 [Mergibacter septicus]